MNPSWHVLLSILAIVLFPSLGSATENKKLYVLLAIDTGSEDLEETVDRDHTNIYKYLKNKVPPSKLELSVLKGKQLTKSEIENHYKKLKPNSEDTLLFYYSGHGVWDGQKKEHYLTPQGGKKEFFIPRSAVRSVMEEKKTSLIILLTDCCSSNLRPKKREVAPEAPEEEIPTYGVKIDPVVRSLFFQHKGLVDVTGAELGTPAWADASDGGIFTRSFLKVLRQPPKKTDYLSWEEFYPALDKTMATTFLTWAKEMNAKARSRGEQEPVDQKEPQRPHKFALPERPTEAIGKRFAVVSVSNELAKEVECRYRWSAKEEWTTITLQPNDTKVVSKEIKPKEDLPKLLVELQMGDVSKTVTWEAKEWIGEKDPPFHAPDAKRLVPVKKK